MSNDRIHAQSGASGFAPDVVEQPVSTTYGAMLFIPSQPLAQLLLGRSQGGVSPGHCSTGPHKHPPSPSGACSKGEVKK